MSAHPLPVTVEVRFASVEHQTSYLRTPLNWKLRLWGQSVGGYGILNGSSSSYGTRARAETAAAIWMATGVTPAHQTDAMRAEYAVDAAPAGLRMECAA